MPSADQPTRTPYSITLHHIEACNCDVACQCQFGGGPLPGHCEFLIGFQVIDGRFGSVALNGVKFVVAAQYPKAIHEGHGKVVLFIDDGATPPQVEAVSAVLSGKAGGMPWEALAGTVESFQGPIIKPIQMTIGPRRSGFRIDGVLEVQQTPITDAVTGEEKEVRIVYPKGGFLWDDGDICTTAAMRLDFGGIRFQHQGHYSAYAVARWAN